LIQVGRWEASLGKLTLLLLDMRKVSQPYYFPTTHSPSSPTHTAHIAPQCPTPPYLATHCPTSPTAHTTATPSHRSLRRGWCWWWGGVGWCVMWCGVVVCGGVVVWCAGCGGVVWCGVVWCGVVWCVVVWCAGCVGCGGVGCGVVWCGRIIVPHHTHRSTSPHILHTALSHAPPPRTPAPHRPT
jgi:hypothetical protein